MFVLEQSQAFAPGSLRGLGYLPAFLWVSVLQLSILVRYRLGYRLPDVGADGVFAIVVMGVWNSPLQLRFQFGVSGFFSLLHFSTSQPLIGILDEVTTLASLQNSSQKSWECEESLAAGSDFQTGVKSGQGTNSLVLPC